MWWKFRWQRWTAVFIVCLVYCVGSQGAASYFEDNNHKAQTSENFINQLAEDTWGYLSSDWAVSNNLPWSWRSASLPGGDYANPAEIGLLALSWIAAYDLKASWSPSWDETEGHVLAILDQLRAWQTGSQTVRPNGPNAYDDSVFYQWYWVSWMPPVVGDASGTNHLVPSIDNAWLAACLITIQQYALANDRVEMATGAGEILADMDFRKWYDVDSDQFYWGGIEDPHSGSLADVYSNENRMINFVARALGDIDQTEFRRSLRALSTQPGVYGGVEVQQMAWDGSLFTYASPALFIREAQSVYGTLTLTPAVQAQIDYAAAQGYTAWGLSDCYDIADGGYIQQGSPPVMTSSNPETHLGVISPHASALALITPLSPLAENNLAALTARYPLLYQRGYGFLDSVMANPSDPSYTATSARFSTLNQEWIFLAYANAQNGFIWKYFYLHAGVRTAHQEMYPELYLPLIQR